MTRRSTLAEIAGQVAGALGGANIAAVLTGGACATIYSEGAYQSHDLDFIIRGSASRKSLDETMASVGFAREGDRYVHPSTPFFVEFPRGPLAIGDDVQITPVQLKLRGGSVQALSPTDSCRDRLAAFYHWSDRHSLDVAVAIAAKNSVNMAAVRRWSRSEGFEDRFEEFRQELRRFRTPARHRRARPKHR